MGIENKTTKMKNVILHQYLPVAVTQLELREVSTSNTQLTYQFITPPENENMVSFNDFTFPFPQ